MVDDLIRNPGVLKIVRALENFKGHTRLVGGCVRDSIINRNTTDIDLATDLLPDTVLQALRASNIKCIPTGLKHGTITAMVKGVPYEITTLRQDLKCDGRHAEVSFTNNWKEDASRRDFTFNALYCDLNGKIHDYFLGIRDLQNRTIAFIGDAEKRVNEDFLRILRVFRFHASICSNNTLSSQILDVCAKYANNLSSLSRERIRSEFFKLLSTENCAKTLDVMHECSVLPQVIPYHLDTKPLLSSFLAKKPPLIKLAASLKYQIPRQYALEVTNNVTHLLRLSNKESKKLGLLLSTHVPFPLSDTQKQQFLNTLGSEILIYLAIMDFTRENTLMTENMLQEHIIAVEKLVPSVFPVSGKDLIQLGYKQGKHLGTTLSLLRNTWEQNPYSNKEYLLSIASKLPKSH